MNTTSYKAHGFASDRAFESFEAAKHSLKQAISAPVFFSQKAAENLKDAILSNDPAKVDAANKALAMAMATTDAVRHGYLPDELQGQKAVTQGWGNQLPTVSAQFISFGDETQLDMEWMRIYQTDVLTESLLASIWEIADCIEWHDLDTDTSSIPESNIVEANWTIYKPKYKGVKVNLSRTLLAKDPYGYLTHVVQGFRYKGELKKTRDSYTHLQALILAANSAGYTTSFTTNLRETINAAALTLRQRNANKGYALNRNTPLLLVANEALLGGTEANFVTTNTMQFPVVVAQYPIERSYTLNLPVDMGISGTKGVLVLSNRKNRFGMFDQYSSEQFQKPENNALCVIGRMAYNHIGEDEQIQIFNYA